MKINKKWIKLGITFIEDCFPKSIVILYFSLLLLFGFLSLFTDVINVCYWNQYLEIITQFFKLNSGILLTITSVFIGIFFTVFSILGSLNVNSTFAMISRENFLKLIKFILFSFISAILFLFFMLIINSLEAPLLDFYITFIVLPLSIYIFSSSVRLGLYLFFIYRNEIDNLHSKLNTEQKKEDKLDQVVYRLDNFLNEYEESKEKEWLEDKNDEKS